MPSPQTGSQQFVGVRFDTVRNTAELVPNVVLKVISNSVDLKKSREKEEIQYGDRANIYDDYTSSANVEGDIEALINTKDVGWWLKAALGKVVSAQEATTGAYRHTFTHLNLASELSTELPTFTLFAPNASAGLYKYVGCVFEELSIEIGDKESKISGKIKGLRRVKVTNSTEITNIKAAIVYTAPDPKLLWGNLKVKYAATVATLDASTNFIKLLPSLKIDIKNNVEYDYSTNDQVGEFKTPTDTLASNFEVSVETGGVIVRDSTLDDFFVNDTANAYEFVLDRQGAGGSVIGTSTLHEILRFRVSKAKAVVEIDRPTDKHVAYKLSLPTLINSVETGWPIQILLQNSTTSY